MARPRSRLLELESDDVFYGACHSDHATVAVHAMVACTILFLVHHLTAGFFFPHAAAVCAVVLYGACDSFLDRDALLDFLCWAASGALAARLGFSTGCKVLYTFAGCEPRPGFQAATPPPSSVYTSTRRTSTIASTQRKSNS